MRRFSPGQAKNRANATANDVAVCPLGKLDLYRSSPGVTIVAGSLVGRNLGDTALTACTKPPETAHDTNTNSQTRRNEEKKAIGNDNNN